MGDKWNDIITLLVESLTRYGLDIAAAIVIAIIGWIVSRWVASAVRSLGRRTEHIDRTLVPTLASVARTFVLAVTLMAVLDKFGVDTTSMLAVLGAFGVGVGLALKDTVSDVASGILLLVLRPFDVGDEVDIDGTTGVIEAIDVFHVKLTSLDGIPIVLPNTKVRGGKIQNFSRAERRQIELKVKVSARDIGKAIAAVSAVIGEDARVLGEPPPLVHVGAFDAASVELLVRAWASAADFFPTRLDLTRRIKERVDAEGLGP
ncbi:MAG: mechanosensitive ion channel [Polyangiaceae bacterium]|nr:mechanosensitive ion channel [Polyangiaceae bacterium]